jgi:hypothetical protein
LGHADDIAYTDKDLVLYPMVGIKDRGLRVRANFGASPFVYDIGDLYNVCTVCLQRRGGGRF